MGHRNTLRRLGLLGILVIGAYLAGCDDQTAVTSSGSDTTNVPPPTNTPSDPVSIAAAPATRADPGSTDAGSTDPAPADPAPVAGATNTLFGVWVMNRSQGGRGVAPGPGSIIEIQPTRVRVNDRFKALEIIMTYKDLGGLKLEFIGGPDGMFTEPDGSPGLWGYKFEVDGALTFWQPTRIYGFKRDHPIVRERTVGYQFTDADQLSRLEANARLRQFSNAVFRYGAANGGKLPASLEVLVDAGLLKRAGDRPLASPLGPVGDGDGDYWLSPALKLRGRDKEPRVLLMQVQYPEREILIYDRSSVLRGKGVHAVFFDGHIELMDDESFLAARQHVAHAGLDLKLP